ADADRLDRPVHDRVDLAGERLAAGQPGDGVVESDVRPGDRGGAGAAVGLQDVAVEHDRVFPEGLEVDAAPQAAPDQAGDLLRTPADLALDAFPVAAGVG